MAIKDLTGMTVCELDREDFEKLFCHQLKSIPNVREMI